MRGKRSGIVPWFVSNYVESRAVARGIDTSIMRSPEPWFSEARILLFYKRWQAPCLMDGKHSKYPDMGDHSDQSSVYPIGFIGDNAKMSSGLEPVHHGEHDWQ